MVTKLIQTNDEVYNKTLGEIRNKNEELIADYMLSTRKIIVKRTTINLNDLLMILVHLKN